MKRAIFRILAIPLLAAAMSLVGVEHDAYAQGGGGHGHFAGRGGGGNWGGGGGHWGGGHHGGGHFRGGVFIGGPWFYDPFFYPFYAYPYAYPYAYSSPSVIIERREPQEYIMDGPQPEQNYWYYCKESRGYYPQVSRCPGGWMKVIPTPPAEGEPDTEE